MFFVLIFLNIFTLWLIERYIVLTNQPLKVIVTLLIRFVLKLTLFSLSIFYYALHNGARELLIFIAGLVTINFAFLFINLTHRR